jgi:hypothetical protein
MTISRYLLILALGIALISTCSGEIQYSQEVDVSPLYELPVSLKVQSVDDLSELDIFDQLKPYGPEVYLGEWRRDGGGKYPEPITVQVYFEVFMDTQSAADSFAGLCEWVEDSSRIEYGGEGENQYCIS